MIRKNYRLWMLALGLCSPALLCAAQLDDALQVSQDKTRAGQQSQQLIDELSEEEMKAWEEYRHISKVVEDLKVYNARLASQVENQQTRLQGIEKSITEVTVMQRRILPLVEDMIESLEEFVDMDIPFHAREREERIEFLRSNLERPDLSIAEKFRQVLEAYKVESEYGRRIDTYDGRVDINGQERDVTMLRIGRLALLYQTADMQHSGMWNARSNSWEPLHSADYRDAIRQGIRMANRQASTDILQIPVMAAEDK